MKNFDEMQRAVLESGKGDRVQALAESRDGQALLKKLDADRVERVLQSGDSGAVRGLLMEVLRTGEGQRIAKQLEQIMGEK